MNDNDRDADVTAAIKKHATQFEAPASLRGDIIGHIEREVKGGNRLRRPLMEVLLRPVLAFAAGTLFAGVGVALLLEGTRENPLVTAMVSDHARSVVTGQAIEIASANTHTVKPWLSGKLGYSPVVVDLAELGYPLIGGRRGFIGRTAVGVLVYQYEQHELDVYTLPSREFGELPRRLPGESGYNMTAWRIGDIQYVVVSDANSERIRDFGEALRQRQTTMAPAD